MASNKAWYDSLSEEEKEVLRQKRKQGRLKGSGIAKTLLDEKKNKRQEILFDLPWSECTKKEQRQRIFIEQNEACLHCKNTTWLDQKIKLELDHINGDRFDNSRQNLRLLCPNCHSFTETYKIGNNKQPGKTKYSDDEIITSLKENESGYKAMKSLGMNPHGGNYIRLRNIIKKYNVELNYTV